MAPAGLVVPVWPRMTLNSGSITSTSQVLGQKVRTVARASAHSRSLHFLNLICPKQPHPSGALGLYIGPLGSSIQRGNGGQSPQGLGHSLVRVPRPTSTPGARHSPATRTVMRREWRPCALVAAHSYSPPWLPMAPATLSVLLLLERPRLRAPGGARQLIWAGGQASARQVRVKLPPGRTLGGEAASSATTGRSAGRGRPQLSSAH